MYGNYGYRLATRSASEGKEDRSDDGGQHGAARRRLQVQQLHHVVEAALREDVVEHRLPLRLVLLELRRAILGYLNTNRLMRNNVDANRSLSGMRHCFASIRFNAGILN